MNMKKQILTLFSLVLFGGAIFIGPALGNETPQAKLIRQTLQKKTIIDEFLKNFPDAETYATKKLNGLMKNFLASKQASPAIDIFNDKINPLLEKLVDSNNCEAINEVADIFQQDFGKRTEQVHNLACTKISAVIAQRQANQNRVENQMTQARLYWKEITKTGRKIEWGAGLNALEKNDYLDRAKAIETMRKDLESLVFFGDLVWTGDRFSWDETWPNDKKPQNPENFLEALEKYLSVYKGMNPKYKKLVCMEPANYVEIFMQVEKGLERSKEYWSGLRRHMCIPLSSIRLYKEHVHPVVKQCLGSIMAYKRLGKKVRGKKLFGRHVFMREFCTTNACDAKWDVRKGKKNPSGKQPIPREAKGIHIANFMGQDFFNQFKQMRVDQAPVPNRSLSVGLKKMALYKNALSSIDQALIQVQACSGSVKDGGATLVIKYARDCLQGLFMGVGLISNLRDFETFYRADQRFRNWLLKTTKLESMKEIDTFLIRTNYYSNFKSFLTLIERNMGKGHNVVRFIKGNKLNNTTELVKQLRLLLELAIDYNNIRLVGDKFSTASAEWDKAWGQALDKVSDDTKLPIIERIFLNRLESALEIRKKTLIGKLKKLAAQVGSYADIEIEGSELKVKLLQLHSEWVKYVSSYAQFCQGVYEEQTVPEDLYVQLCNNKKPKKVFCEKGQLVLD